MSAMQQAGQKLGLEHRCIWAGYQPDAADYCAAMDVLLITSLYEGLPMVVLHAIACNTPVVSTDVGGIGACVGDGLGRVLPVSDGPLEYAQAVIQMRELKCDPAYGIRCAERLADRFRKCRMQAQLKDDLARITTGINRERRLEDYQLQLMAKPLLF